MADGHDFPYGYFYTSENVQNQIGFSQSLPVSGFRHFPETLGNSMGYWSPRGESPSDSSEEASLSGVFALMYVPIEVRIKICCALVVTHVLLLHLRENKQCLSKCGSALSFRL